MVKEIGQKDFTYRHELRVAGVRVSFEIYTHTTERFGISLRLATHFKRAYRFHVSVSEPHIVTDNGYGGYRREPYSSDGRVEACIVWKSQTVWHKWYDFKGLPL